MAEEIIFGAEDSIVVEETPTTPERKNVQRKNVVAKSGKLGELAHYHKMEDENEIWDEPCVFVEHFIGAPRGLDINGEKYSGKVIVPECVASTLGVMENHWEAAEVSLYRGRNFQRVVGSY